MGIRKYKPTTPGRRGASVSDFAEITRSTPEKSLIRPLHSTGGRNAHGRITTRLKKLQGILGPPASGAQQNTSLSRRHALPLQPSQRLFGQWPSHRVPQAPAAHSRQQLVRRLTGQHKLQVA